MSKYRSSASVKSGNPLVNRLLTGGAAGLFYFWCMLLPLVGKAGSRSPQARENFITVLAVLLLALSTAGLACWRLRTQPDVSRGTLKGMYGFCCVQAGMLLLLLAGAFAV